ncbi:CCA tRNA nucleotidyltransferase 1, mitochondrial [Osmia lignaria lignaria]|uniref:CCA tRNA nucleotidyltransferase 1, mitochondrial n=1 Tax=Osmia lignaria lignaria TaxID=1437193 RepID=UPI0014794CB4|nr:CCA tRNA nucleotidyltransferase 1, mitochondrial [Osmia lignaria]XP_034193042.1 CCA tRNA nucleotidyltransferase 1, mitochondrial [Osmia lignaria]XP_034193043.1 CCA tRNA nucleotidyltransferase 1, mitochondrial [Osmia lignaria]
MLKVFRYVNFSTSNQFFRGHRTWQKVIMKDEVMPPSRLDPVITKLDNALFHSLFTSELNTLAQLFKKRNYELRIAGGAVRDILMGIKPKDLDFATDATPQEMKSMFIEEDVRLINTNGEKHGTITPRINDKENFEVTTLRIDTATDGRHAKVEFTKDWKLDALRRDLTINSMFLDLEGRIYDYFFGYDDLQNRKVVFVGNASLRIREDYLRILRYFRFYGRIAEHPDLHDEKTITAIKENIQGLQNISGERIWSEWSKILSGNFVKEITLKMLECGIARYVGLPENLNVKNFEILCEAAKKNNISFHPVSFLGVMLSNSDEVLQLHNRLKFSAYDRDLAYFLIRCWNENPPIDALKFYKKMLVHWKGSINVAKNYVCELLKCKQQFSLAEEVEKTVIPRFPVSGNSLKEHVKTARMIGIVIKELKDIWLDKDFKLTAEELLQEVPRIVSELEDKCCYQKG